MIRRVVRQIVALLGTALAFALPAGTQELPTIHIAGSLVESQKNIFYGIRSGLFRKYGLNVEFLPASSGAAALASLAGGSVQVATTSVVPLFQAHLRGLPFLIVAPGQWYTSDAPTNAMFVRADSPIRTARDLNGKTIAVQSLKDLGWAAVAAWVDQNGGDVRSVKTIELPQAAVLPAIEEGKIDAGSLATPFIEQGLSSGKVRMLAKNFDAIAKRYEAGVDVATADYIAANRDQMSRFAHAMHDAVAYTNTHPAETLDLIASFTGIDRAVIARGTRTTDPEYLQAQDLQPVIETAFKYQLIDRRFPAEELFSSVLLRLPG
jgi:NitT/TauT family transport system substrate-binding protein